MSHLEAEYIMKALIYWLFLLNLVTASEYRMLVTWGKPLAFSEPVTLEVQWADCLQLCLNTDNCVLIHDTPPTCEVFRYDQISTVQKMSSESRVAFRVPTSNQTCYGPENEPLLIGETVETTFNGGKIYNVTLQNDVWTFRRDLECPPTSVKFLRGNVEVCMQIVRTPECLIRSDAAAQCANLGIPNTLMGVASKKEMNYITSLRSTMVNEQMTTINYRRVCIWIDGERKQTCMPPTPKIGPCNGYNEFDYSDPTAPNPAFTWRENQPDGLTIGGPNANCLFLRFASDEDVGVGDMLCNVSYNADQKVCYAGYLCGTYAT